MSQFIESIKVEDQKPYLLALHQKRVNDTFSHFGAQGTIDLEKIYHDLNHDEEGLYKLRMVYDLHQNVSVQMIPYAIAKVASFQLVENDSFEYPFKGEDRKEIEAMKAKAKTEEIIIVKRGQITDTSYSNLLFLKDDIWYTPSSYLLNGVQRQHLLQSQQIRETEITLKNIRDFTHFQLINALNDFDDLFFYPLESIVNLPKSSAYLEL